MRCREERVILQCQSDATVDAKRSDEATKRFECVPRAGAFRKVAAGRFPGVPRDPFSYSRRGEIRRGIFAATRETK